MAADIDRYTEIQSGILAISQTLLMAIRYGLDLSPSGFHGATVWRAEAEIVLSFHPASASASAFNLSLSHITVIKSALLPAISLILLLHPPLALVSAWVILHISQQPLGIYFNLNNLIRYSIVQLLPYYTINIPAVLKEVISSQSAHEGDSQASQWCPSPPLSFVSHSDTHST